MRRRECSWSGRSGPIFRSIDHWEALEERALTPQSISLIVKRRCASPGWRQEFSVHGLRSDYLTEAWCLLTRGDATVAAIARCSRQPVITTRQVDDSVELYGLGFEPAQQPEAELRFGLRRAGMG